VTPRPAADTFPGTSTPTPPIRPYTAAHDWLTRHDPGYGAARRALRAAIFMPGLFALADKVIANATMAYFIAFGSFAMLLFVDFTGSLAERLRAQFALGVACAVLICLGTLAEQSTPVAVIAMGVVGVAILFAGVVSSVLASATTALLLAFILPVTLPGPVSQIPDRVAGWGLAAAVSLFAITLLWPAPTRNPIRARALEACRALADRLRAQVAYIRSDRSPASEAQRDAAIARTEAATQALEKLFFATPYRPTGLSTDARAVVRLIDELGWLAEIVQLAKPGTAPSYPDREVCEVKLAAAEVLDRAAALLGSPRDPVAPLRASEVALRTALAALEAAATSRLPDSGPGVAAAARPSAQALVSSLDPSFRAQEISYIVGQIAQNVEYAAAAEGRRTVDRILGRQPTGFTGTLSSAGERARAFARLNSAWLHNSLRGGAALAAAVLIVDLLSVQHAFWVVFGTLAVLRTNAFSTGQNGVRAVVGTSLGFVIGGVIVYLVGTNTTVLWILLPIAVLIAGIAPVALSFTAGQAAFTMTLLLLFNLLSPVGWRIGIVRVEDVAIGCGVSLVVGLVFWPRGAARALGTALSEAYAAGVRYLDASVAYGLGCCDAAAGASAPPQVEAAAAAAAARRLDDIFRGYLSDRGTKSVPLSEVTSLVSGVAGVRLAADAVVDLWSGAAPAQGDRVAARRTLTAASARMSGWFDHFAAGLTGAEELPDALDRDAVADGQLIDAVAHDLGDGDGHATATGVRVIWTGDHLDAVRRLQESLIEPARAAVAQHALVP
jgi:uncharacterized membrane protein YccC